MRFQRTKISRKATWNSYASRYELLTLDDRPDSPAVRSFSDGLGSFDFVARDDAGQPVSRVRLIREGGSWLYETDVADGEGALEPSEARF